MAWHNSGSTNDELVDNMVENNLITSKHVIAAFRDVDRAYFVPKGSKHRAYRDSPFKSGKIHISAPHIYCKVVESLDLEPGSTLSFLNIGSGTGYLSSIVAHILGPKSPSFGVEIHKEVIEFSRVAIGNWKSSGEDFADLSIDIYHGNGLEIEHQGESRMGYDRIYVGAGINNLQLQQIQALMAPGGILIAPVGDRLLKIKRMGGSQSGSFDDSELRTECLTGVHFTSLRSSPKKSLVIPSVEWCPSRHRSYSEDFQNCTTTLLMCSRASYIQPPVPVAYRNEINVAATLPKEIWLYILSFTNRKWFETGTNEVEILKSRLRQERSSKNEARQELEYTRAKHRAVTSERDLYLNFILRWHHILDRNEIEAKESSERDEEDSRSLSTRIILEEANNILSRCHARSQLMDIDSSSDTDDERTLDGDRMDIGLENESNQMMVHSDTL